MGGSDVHVPSFGGGGSGGEGTPRATPMILAWSDTVLAPLIIIRGYIVLEGRW